MLRVCLLLIAMAPSILAESAHQYVMRTFDRSQPGAAMIVRKHGRTVYAVNLGRRDLRTKAPLDARTNFRLASVTKQFTATAVMLLVRDGKLRYGTRLTDVFPDFPAYGHEVTIRHLLNHTSGLPDYEELMDNAGKQWTAEQQITDAVTAGVAKGLKGAALGAFVAAKDGVAATKTEAQEDAVGHKSHGTSK